MSCGAAVVECQLLALCSSGTWGWAEPFAPSPSTGYLLLLWVSTSACCFLLLPCPTPDFLQLQPTFGLSCWLTLQGRLGI